MIAPPVYAKDGSPASIAAAFREQVRTARRGADWHPAFGPGLQRAVVIPGYQARTAAVPPRTAPRAPTPAPRVAKAVPAPVKRAQTRELLAAGVAMSYRIARTQVSGGVSFYFAPGAFAESIARGDVLACLDHWKSTPIGSMKDGALRVYQTAQGIEFDMRIDTKAATHWGVASEFDGRGRLSVSIGYEWSRADLRPGQPLPTLMRADLLEISLLTVGKGFDPTAVAGIEIGCSNCRHHNLRGYLAVDAKRARRCQRCRMPYPD